ncbi:MAG: DUF885 domain-containing protein, partial [bacterium]
SSVGHPELMTLFAEWDEAFLRLNPLEATSRGDHRFDGDWGPDALSDEYQQEYEQLNRDYLQRLLAIDPVALSSSERLSYDVFRYERELTLEAFDQGFVSYGNLTPINQFFSIANYLALLGSGSNAQPFKTTADYDNWITRSDGFVKHVDLLIVRMREGVERGVVQPRILMQKLLPQLEAQVVDDVSKSPFWKPIDNFPASVSEEDRQHISAIYEEHIAGVLLPAYRRLHDFIRDEYLPHARESFGLSALPGGREYYDYRVRLMTTSDLNAEQIHALGLAEVERLMAEIDAVRMRVGFEGDIPAFFDHLRHAPEFYAESGDQLVESYRTLKARIEPRLNELFNIQPATDYQIKEIEPFRAPSMAAAQYYPGSADGQRPGIFYVNTHKLDSRALYMTEALSLHEASPGHHFQISVSQEQDDLPNFRRFGRHTAYVEGWALYAESLGKELGLYEDPYQYFGSLYTEIWRANRLVVDTGLHTMGWTREKAVDWMLDHMPIVESDAIAEVDRYIAMPGQALSYKIGQLKIRELRSLGEQQLGERFDIRAFHDQVLTAGSVPLVSLEQQIKRWIDAQRT